MGKVNCLYTQYAQITKQYIKHNI